MLSKRITAKLASNSSVKFVSHTLSAVLLRKLMNVMKNKVSFGWLTDISSFIILLPSIIIVIWNKFFPRYWLITEYWLLSTVLFCPFRLGWEFLYTNNVRWAGKHIIANNNDQFSHLTFKHCHFTTEVLVSSWAAKLIPMKELGRKWRSTV